MTVGYIPVCQFDTCVDGIIGINDVMVFFVSLLDIMKDMDGLID